ncbi:SCF ubiquitin ligase complex subunit, partial [Tulasnella sp. 417]
MTVFREPDVSPTESSDDEELEEMERSGFEDEGTADAPKIQSPARWSSQFNFLSLHDLNDPHHKPTSQQAAPLSLANLLPHEILLHIFRHLPSTRDLYSVLLVSRSWCQCSVELLWQKPQFSKSNGLFKMMNVLGKKEEDSIFQYAAFIRRLNFTLLGEQLSDQMLLRARKCVRLERLTLFGCHNVKDETLERVLRSTPNLVALDITGVVEASDKAIIAAADTAPRLQGVNLGGCKKITDAGVSALATQCNHLRRIKLSGVENITDVPVKLLAKHCPMLLELDLHNCPLVTDEAIREVWARSTYLREFRLSNVVTLTEKAFPAAPKTNHNTALSNLNLLPGMGGGRPEPGLPPLLLDRLFDHLRVLDLTGCVNLTDEAMEGIVVNCPKIRNLVLAKCGMLTDEAVGSICKLGRYLHYLHLGHVSNITDRAVTRLARACTRLRYIDLACCPLLSDMSVFELAVLPKLRRIGLVRVPNLTDQAIYAIGDTQTSLERIHLSYCENISVQAINYLLQRLQKLTHLSLTGIPAFRRPELQQFCRPPPKEFTQNQRAAFCVYSGHGVIELRRYLQHYMQAQDGGRPAVPRNNGSDADDDDNDGEVDGGFIDLGEVREQESYPPPPAYPPPSGYPSGLHPDGPRGQGPTNGFTHPRAPNVRHRTDTAVVVHPNGTVIHAPTHPQNMQLHLNGSSAGARGSTPSLPFPLTTHTSPTSTPEPNGASQNGQTAGPPSNSAIRRHSPGFLSFATAIARGTWMGGSATRQADATDSSPPRPAVNGNASGAGPSSSQPASLPSSDSPVMRQWNPNPVTWGPVAGGSQLPSPSNSAAAFAMAGSNSQGVSPSNSRHPSSRDA